MGLAGFDQVRAGRTVVLRSLPDDLPAEEVDLREYVARIGIRSQLSIPLRVGGRIIGAIGFGAFHDTRPWPEELIARLKVVGEVFVQALARSRADAELATAHEEIKRLNARLQAENVYLRQATHGGSRERLASRSPAFKVVIEEIDQVAPTNATVLLLGETGTGKELLAEAIHGASARRKRALVKVNCAAIPATLIESELFGREKGAYTGALAAPDRPLRARRRVDALPRRDRRPAARRAGQAPARAPGRPARSRTRARRSRQRA